MVSITVDQNNVRWVNDSNPNDGIRETWQVGGYHNYNGTVVTNVRVIGESDFWLDGNNAANTIGLTLAGDSTLEGSALVTNYTAAGIFGQGTANHIIGGSDDAVRVQSIGGIGIAVSGGATVMNTVAQYIGYGNTNAFGYAGWGANNFYNNDARYIFGYDESVGFSAGINSVLYNNTAYNPSYHTGWSFAFWSGGGSGTNTVSYCNFSGFDTGIGNTGNVALDHTTISAMTYDIVNKSAYTDNGNNSFALATPQNGTINGTAAVNHILGGNGSDTIHGGGGRDVLYGGAGADTFVFIDDGNRVEMPDYNETDGDSIDLGDFDPLGTVSFNGTTHEFLFDGDALAYIPYANSLADITWNF